MNCQLPASRWATLCNATSNHVNICKVVSCQCRSELALGLFIVYRHLVDVELASA
jgi:hypothetical protein